MIVSKCNLWKNETHIMRPHRVPCALVVQYNINVSKLNINTPQAYADIRESPKGDTIGV